MSAETLFPGYEPDPPPGPAIDALHQSAVSPDRRRTLRQADAVTRGVHPLALVLGTVVRMHPDGNRAATRDEPGPGPHCGDCTHRDLITAGHQGTFPKCGRYAPGSQSHSGATDCRAWWPACTHHEAAS